MTIRLADRTKTSSRTKTRDGYLVADAALSRTGIQEYTPAELGFDVPPHLQSASAIRLDRPESEVFAPAAMSALAHLPLTVGHPSDDVGPGNVKELQVGFTMDPITRKGTNAVGKVMVQEKTAITGVERGRDQLSVGYDMDPVWLEPEEAKIKGYDGYMTNITPNHVALVDEARGGVNVRIMDANKEKKMTVKKVIDGVSFEFDAQSAEVVDKLQAKIADSASQHEAETKKLQDSVSELQGKLDASQKELETEKSNRISDEQIAGLVKEKTELVETAKKFVKDGDLLGMSSMDIKKAVVLSVYDGMDLEGKDDTYVGAVYDAAIQTSKGGEAQKVADSVNPPAEGKTVDARQAMIDRRNAKKGKK